MPHQWVAVGVVFSFNAAIIHSSGGRALIRKKPHALSKQHRGPDRPGSVGGPSSPLQVALAEGVCAVLRGVSAPSTAPQGWCLAQSLTSSFGVALARNKLLHGCIWAVQLYFRAAGALQQWQASTSRQAQGKNGWPNPLSSLM